MSDFSDEEKKLILDYSTFEICKKALNLGLDLQYKKLLICHLNNHGVNRDAYQVDCPGRRPFSKLYSSIDDAVKQFIELKNGYDNRH
jgi:hypothetical protein